MEYIKKEELIEGEIYVYSEIFINKITKLKQYEIDCWLSKNSLSYRKPNITGYSNNSNNIRLATPEEKHWLNSCITADKFITFEEAMKTFIPEYVECIEKAPFNFYGEIGTIYEVIDWNYSESDCMLKETTSHSTNKKRFKPSTKEAYDAQFVVKEPEFVLPKLWHIIITSKIYEVLSKYLISKHPRSMLYTSGIMGFYKENKLGHTQGSKTGFDWDFGIEITFEQFKKYVLKKETVEEKVIKPLPQFKVIESIETITKVENNEGNQFFIGDVVKLKSGIVQTIRSFKYNISKSNIIALTDKSPIIGIEIDKIEHYIKPKTNYEILEYKTEGGISCIYINERCKIYSIKRISDNLIITVGDNVLSKTCGVPNKILSIELINNKIRLYPRNSFYNLEDILKINNK